LADTITKNQRIAQNTLMLYVRMLLIMAVTLYTSRIVLDKLGVEDFGIYNLVAGIVVLFSFVNNAMATATQRFLNFELGKKNLHEVKRIFSMSMTAHISISLLVLFLAETIGVWFLLSEMNIPNNRMEAAVWCYQFSILIACVQIIRVPYNSCIIAYERMSFYAYLSILEVGFNLLIAFLLTMTNCDRLILYSFLMFIVAVFISGVYKIVCNRYFVISKYTFFWDYALYKKIISFSGWSLLGSTANVGVQQGLNILLNIFYGVTLNAAMGIANQVSRAVYNFVSNFQIAFNPQIIKSYASGDYVYFERLIFKASRYSYFLLFLVSLPVLLNSEFLLSVWLKDVPEYAVTFSQLIICFLLIDALSAPLWISAQAMGRIRNYQLLMSGIILLNLPLGYIVLNLGMRPEMVLVIRVIINFLAWIFRVLYLRSSISFPVRKYLKEVFLVVLVITVISIPLPFWISLVYSSWKGLIMTTVFSVLTTIFAIFLIGLEKNEKTYIMNFIQSKLKK
jgi:conserved hypothetical transmembrane protein; putative transmembrane protein